MTDYQVAIIGRANVGKSTLFNRLVGKELALTDPQPGTTRDTNLALVYWCGINFWLADSAGLEQLIDSTLTKSMVEKSKKLLKQAKILLWVIDGQTGLTPHDRSIAKLFKNYRTKVIAVVNKIDNLGLRKKYAGKKILGFATNLVSSKNGSGTGDLLDQVTAKLTASITMEAALNITIVGKPNVGKSSIMNELLGEERSLVDQTPHTTRDSQRGWFTHQTINWCLIDTAGIRRKANAATLIEERSIAQTLDNLQKADVVLLVLDNSQTFSFQDQRLGQFVAEAKKPIIVLLNKSDLLAKNSWPQAAIALSKWLPMLSWAPVKFVSATNHFGLKNLLPLAHKLHRDWQTQLSLTEEETVTRACWHYFKNNKKLKFLRFRQTNIRPPSFIITLAGQETVPKALIFGVEKIIRKQINKFRQLPLRLEINTKRGV
ncbi:MAG: ribosome biogenesis GTPase Der [Patescibacteria group bacterium]